MAAAFDDQLLDGQAAQKGQGVAFELELQAGDDKAFEVFLSFWKFQNGGQSPYDLAETPFADIGSRSPFCYVHERNCKPIFRS